MRHPMLFYIASLLLFGSNGIVASYIEMSSYEIVMFRTLIGGVMLMAIYLIINKRFTFYKYLKSFAYLALAGVAAGISWILLYKGYQETGVSISSLCYYCGPVILMAVSPFLFKERFTVQKVICFAVVFAGVVMINGNVSGGFKDSAALIGAIMSAFMFGAMLAFNKLATDIKGLENSALQLIFSFLTVFVYALFKQGFHFSIPTTSIFPMLFLGIVNTGFGCFMYFSAMRHIGVQTVAIMGYLEPLSAVIFAVVVLRETLSPLQIFGVVCILLGAALAEVKIHTHHGRHAHA